MIIETKNIEVEATTPLRKALEMLESSPVKIILVLDSDRTLVGTVTDGDFRRAILRGARHAPTNLRRWHANNTRP